MRKLRVAVVGMGIGRPNGLALAHNPRAEVVALCDLVEERMNEFALLLPQPGDRRRIHRHAQSVARADGAESGGPRQACLGDQAAG